MNNRLQSYQSPSHPFQRCLFDDELLAERSEVFGIFVD
jgi:hypothetical protein